MAFVLGLFRRLCVAVRVLEHCHKIQVRWSGLLFGIMMFLFVAIVHIPRVLASPKDRFAWVIVIREMSFAGGAWILAANTMRGQNKNKLINVGRMLIALSIFCTQRDAPESRLKN
jgi:hypothetical protein